jgi:predicted phosphodiesterase
VRIHVLSDLHLEFGPVPLPPVDADAVVLAGDIAVGLRGIEWASRTFAGRPILYVPGNHEYYGQTYPRFLDKMRARALELGVVLLSDSAVTIDGVRFLGATLWTDFELTGDRRMAEAAARDVMVDFKKIRIEPNFRRAKPKDVQLWHIQSRRWLDTELSTPHSGGTVVITHHAPSLRSLDATRPRHPVDAAYASDLEALVERSGVDCWVHGHTHHCVDYRLGATRILSNQRGYPDEPVDRFNPAFVAGVGSRASDASSSAS